MLLYMLVRKIGKQIYILSAHFLTQQFYGPAHIVHVVNTDDSVDLVIENDSVPGRFDYSCGCEPANREVQAAVIQNKACITFFCRRLTADRGVAEQVGSPGVYMIAIIIYGQNVLLDFDGDIQECDVHQKAGSLIPNSSERRVSAS